MEGCGYLIILIILFFVFFTYSELYVNINLPIEKDKKQNLR